MGKPSRFKIELTLIRRRKMAERETLITRLIEDTCRYPFRPLREDKGYYDRQLTNGYWTIGGVEPILKSDLEESDFRELNLISLSFLKPVGDELQQVTFRRFTRIDYDDYKMEVFRIPAEDFNEVLNEYRKIIEQVQEPAYLYGKVLTKHPFWWEIPEERKEKFLRLTFEYCQKPLPQKEIFDIIADGGNVREHLEKCQTVGLVHYFDLDSFFWNFAKSHTKEISEFLGFKADPQILRRLYNGVSIVWDFVLMENWESQLSVKEIKGMVKQLEEQLKQNRDVILLKVVNFPTTYGYSDGWLVMDKESAEDLFTRWRGSVTLDLNNNLQRLIEGLAYPPDTLKTVSNGYWTAEREKDGRIEVLHVFLARHFIDGMKFLTVEEMLSKDPEVVLENFKRFERAYKSIKSVVPEARPFLEKKVEEYREQVLKPAVQELIRLENTQERNRSRGR